MPSSQIKILYLITLGEQGGAQKYVLDLAVHLQQAHKKYQIAVASGGVPNNHLQQQVADLNITYYYLSYLQRQIKPVNDLLAFRQIFKLCRRYRPDVIHLNSSKAGTLGALAAKLAGVKKVIYTVHGLVLNEPLNLKQKIFYWLAEWLSAKFKDHLICVSQADKQSLLKNRLTSANKITVIYNSIDLNTFNFFDQATARQQLSQFINYPLTDQAFIIGTIANLYKNKGLNYLIKAAHIVCQKYSQTKFIIIGEGPQRKTLTQLIKILNLEKKVFLVGALPQAPNYLKAFNVFVLPSVKEGFPYTLLEAMAAQLPIVATYVGGISEIIEHEHNGLLIPPANQQPLSQTLIKLIKNEKLRLKLANAQHKLIKQFNLSYTLQQTEKIYLT